MKSDYITPHHRLNPHQEKKLVKLFAWIAVLIVLFLYWHDSKARTVTFQAKESTATVFMRTKCPGADATFSRSIWNRGGWPLWSIVCYYKEAK